MRIIILCEESQAVAIAFRKLGHEAYSCDLLPCSGGHPEWHYQGDALGIFVEKWDLKVSFPPCTDLTLSGARWFKTKRESGQQEKSIRFFFDTWKISDVTENPIGIMNGGKYIKKWFPDLYQEMKEYGFPFKSDQIIQPWWFGHGETKATCLWKRNKNLPDLKATNIVEGREQRIWKMAPSEDRAKLRSKTYPGIADAIADQYSKYLTVNA